MKTAFQVFCILIISCCPLANAAHRKVSVAADRAFSLSHGGLQRKYIVHVPPSYGAGQSAPVIIALHGGGGNALSAVNFFQLDEKADQEGFLVVYPEGTGRRVAGKLFGTWNAGRCCGPAQEKNVDDVGFISLLIERLQEDFSVDAKRIYVTGMSNGALMAYRLACEISDKIAAIAPSGGHDAFDGCAPSRHVPVIHFHGSDDPCALYNGGGCGGCGAEIINGIGLPSHKGPLWQCRSVPEYLKEWRRLDGCQSLPVITFEKGSVRCATYGLSPDGAEVTLCTVNGMGHTWLGSATHGMKACETRPNGLLCRMWEKTVGKLNTDARANDLMWDFFKKHPLP